MAAQVELNFRFAYQTHVRMREKINDINNKNKESTLQLSIAPFKR